MGWLFGWDTRKQLVDHLTDGNGVKTLKRCFKGNNMWAVQECKDGTVFACLYLIRGPAYGNKNDRDGWGYKDVDETMGPNQTDFPPAWLDLLSPCDSPYSVDWRAAVRQRGEKLKQAKLKSKWKGYGHTFEIIARRSPTSFRAIDEDGMTWRLTQRNIIAMEIQS